MAALCLLWAGTGAAKGVSVVGGGGRRLRGDGTAANALETKEPDAHSLGASCSALLGTTLTDFPVTVTIEALSQCHFSVDASQELDAEGITVTVERGAAHASCVQLTVLNRAFPLSPTPTTMPDLEMGVIVSCPDLSEDVSVRFDLERPVIDLRVEEEEDEKVEESRVVLLGDGRRLEEDVTPVSCTVVSGRWVTDFPVAVNLTRLNRQPCTFGMDVNGIPNAVGVKTSVLAGTATPNCVMVFVGSKGKEVNMSSPIEVEGMKTWVQGGCSEGGYMLILIDTLLVLPSPSPTPSPTPSPHPSSPGLCVDSASWSVAAPEVGREVALVGDDAPRFACTAIDGETMTDLPLVVEFSVPSTCSFAINASADPLVAGIRSTVTSGTGACVHVGDTPLMSNSSIVYCNPSATVAVADNCTDSESVIVSFEAYSAPAPSATPSPSLSSTPSPSLSSTPSVSSSPSSTPSNATNATATPSLSVTPSFTPSPTSTPTFAPSNTPTPSSTTSQSFTPSHSPSPINTTSASPSHTPSQTPTTTVSSTQSPSSTPSHSSTPTSVAAPSSSRTPTPSATPSGGGGGGGGGGGRGRGAGGGGFVPGMPTWGWYAAGAIVVVVVVGCIGMWVYRRGRICARPQQRPGRRGGVEEWGSGGGGAGGGGGGGVHDAGGELRRGDEFSVPHPVHGEAGDGSGGWPSLRDSPTTGEKGAEIEVELSSTKASTGGMLGSVKKALRRSRDGRMRVGSDSGSDGSGGGRVAGHSSSSDEDKGRGTRRFLPRPPSTPPPAASASSGGGAAGGGGGRAQDAMSLVAELGLVEGPKCSKADFEREWASGAAVDMLGGDVDRAMLSAPVKEVVESSLRRARVRLFADGPVRGVTKQFFFARQAEGQMWMVEVSISAAQDRVSVIVKGPRDAPSSAADAFASLIDLRLKPILARA